MKSIVSGILFICSAILFNPIEGFCQTNTDTILYINHAMRFGMCDGYCAQQIKFSSELALRHAEYQSDLNEEMLPDINDSVTISSTEWKSITESIDLTVFFALPTKIGYPDCSDGGSEWLEIATTHTVYRVEYNFGSSPEGLTNLLKLVRLHKFYGE